MGYSKSNAADIIRIVHSHFQILGTIPTFVRNLVYEHLHKGMHYDISRRLLPFIEQLGILSKRRNSYKKDPFNSVMDAAEEIGIVKT